MADKPKQRRQAPLNLDMSFDEAMQRILKAKPLKKVKRNSNDKAE